MTRARTLCSGHAGDRIAEVVADRDRCAGMADGRRHDRRESPGRALGTVRAERPQFASSVAHPR